MPGSSRILNDQHKQQLQNALDVLMLHKPEIDLAKRAGINVEQQEKQINDTEARLRQMLNVYFPNG